MDENSKEQLDPQELEQANGELLPDREAMSLVTLPQPIQPVPGDIAPDYTDPVMSPGDPSPSDA